ncbi:hypothetical protein STRPS_0725 [Streptococcus pseudoporcinus LQ 940-04]|uniref:Uncharacterized protein n=1 Tax=Streptococcus pseudoporcinus LQ 940-04 TaxID=875093 RepID=G5K9I1_9STRE|nr:hypothetical protein STRPS_0725 [Streptococcus pseudoporcinus LQ 940-04]
MTNRLIGLLLIISIFNLIVNYNRLLLSAIMTKKLPSLDE